MKPLLSPILPGIRGGAWALPRILLPVGCRSAAKYQRRQYARKTSMANMRKQNARTGMGKAHAGTCRACAHEGHAQAGARYAHTKGLIDVGLYQRRLCCRLCLWKHAQCTEQRTGREIVCRSPGVYLVAQVGSCCVSARCPIAQLLDHLRHFPQICSNASCRALGTA